MRPGLLSLLLSLLASPLHGAGDITAAFESANRLYEQEKYRDAAEAYQQLVDAGQVSPAVLFNLGNALYKSGQTGHAIVHYRRAAELDPRDPDILANLQFARASVPGGSSGRRELWRRWLGRVSLNEWTLTTAALFWSWMLLLAAGVWQPTWKKSLRPLLLASGLATFLTAGGLSRVAWDRFGTEPVVVIVPEATVRNGPLDESQAFFPVRNGLELRVIDRKDGWVRIEDNARRAGWIRQESLAWIHQNG